MSDANDRKIQVGGKITAELKDRLDRAAAAGLSGYPITAQAILERGIVLALNEIEAIQKSAPFRS